MKKIIFLAFLSINILAKLPSYNIDITQTTVSGLSSGGAMTQQMTYVFSSTIRKSATIAGIPFGCAQGSIAAVSTACTVQPKYIDTDLLIKSAKDLEEKKLIDPLSNINGQIQWFYSGTIDSVVRQGVVQKCQELGDKLGALTSNKFDIQGEHAWPTNNYGNNCTYLGEPYISNCDYESSQVVLKLFLGDQYKEPVPQKKSNLIQFDQGEYSNGRDSLNKLAYIYVPTNCLNGQKCTLHVNFHGCSQTLADIGEQWVKSLGLNEIAEANNIVILYPQTVKSLVNPTNPNGCWDFWGYTSPSDDKLQYLTNNGPQLKAVYQMMVDLSSQKENQK